jgi:hypothetical protein
LRPADRPETWAEYQHRRRILALWRSIGDFVVKGHFASFADLILLAPYRQPMLPPRPFVPFTTLLGGGIVPGSPQGEPITLPWSPGE